MGQSSTLPVKKWILDILFPRKCLSCGTLLSTHSSHAYMCAACFDDFPLPAQLRCAFCQGASPTGATCILCKTSHALDGLLVSADYTHRVAERLVKTLKYRFVPEAAKDMAELMARHITPLLPRLQLPRATFLTAVPLHSRRLRWRGFNQAQELARHLSTGLRIPFASDILTRNRGTKPQAEIEERVLRIANARNLFSVPFSITGSTVLLVDDVSTTGATLDDAARTLKAAGAARVIGIVFARG